MPDFPDNRINNPGSDPDSDRRRSGGSSNDPHGGHENIDSEQHGPNPDPIEELVPGGTGELPAAKISVSEENDDLAFTDSQVPNVPEDQLSEQTAAGAGIGDKTPGFGPTELDRPLIEGNPDLGIDPHDVKDNRPPRETNYVEK